MEKTYINADIPIVTLTYKEKDWSWKLLFFCGCV
jgi:hypothetical protein